MRSTTGRRSRTSRRGCGASRCGCSPESAQHDPSVLALLDLLVAGTLVQPHGTTAHGDAQRQRAMARGRGFTCERAQERGPRAGAADVLLDGDRELRDGRSGLVAQERPLDPARPGGAEGAARVALRDHADVAGTAPALDEPAHVRLRTGVRWRLAVRR